MNGSFPVMSRYHAVPVDRIEVQDGVFVVYLRRRMVPPPETFPLLRHYTVAEGDRLDNVTARFLGDPEQFWRICDANRIMHPREAEIVGRGIRITMPNGLAGGAS
jgi:hypothetical protein